MSTRVRGHEAEVCAVFGAPGKVIGCHSRAPRNLAVYRLFGFGTDKCENPVRAELELFPLDEVRDPPPTRI